MGAGGGVHCKNEKRLLVLGGLRLGPSDAIGTVGPIDVAINTPENNPLRLLFFEGHSRSRDEMGRVIMGTKKTAGGGGELGRDLRPWVWAPAGSRTSERGAEGRGVLYR